MRQTHLTPAQFRSKITKLIRNANTDAKNLSIKWQRCNRCTWADGSQGFSGAVLITADGFRPTQRIVTADDHGFSA